MILVERKTVLCEVFRDYRYWVTQANKCGLQDIILETINDTFRKMIGDEMNFNIVPNQKQHELIAEFLECTHKIKLIVYKIKLEKYQKRIKRNL